MNDSDRQKLMNHLRDSIKVAYQQALDADAQLDALANENLAQFESVLKPGSGFSSDSVRFQPYVEELGQDLLALANSDDFTADLQKLALKLKLLLQTLARFKSLGK